MRKLILIGIFFAAIISFMSLDASDVNAQDNDNIKVILNGSSVEFDTAPYIKDGRTLVPFRKLFESFGITEIYWDDNEKSISARNKTTDVYLKIGQTTALINGYEIRLDVAPEITNGRTFVPLRFVSENLGADIEWNQASKTIFMNYSNKEYKFGQIGTNDDLKFSIDTATSDNGILKVVGKINTSDKNLVIVASDEYGDFASSNFNLFGVNEGMYNMEADVYLSTCHQFEAKYFIIKILESDKLINLGQYTSY